MIFLRRLTWFQHQHDYHFHHDIAYLPKMKRFNHLVHHMNKYVSDRMRPNRCEDMLAVILSSAVTFNIDLNKVINTIHRHDGNVQPTDALIHFAADRDVIENAYRVSLSNISKVIEGFDHIEDINYIGEIEKFLVTVFLLNMTDFLVDNKDPSQLYYRYFNRINDIQMKNHLHKYIWESLSFYGTGEMSSWSKIRFYLTSLEK